MLLYLFVVGLLQFSVGVFLNEITNGRIFSNLIPVILEMENVELDGTENNETSHTKPLAKKTMMTT